MSPAFEKMLNRELLKKQSVSLETVAEVLARVVAAAPEPVPRVDIADGTMLIGAHKLPHGSVSRASTVLIDMKLLQQENAVAERPGRPIVPLRLSQEWALAGVQVTHADDRTATAVGMLLSLDGTPAGEKVTEPVRWPFNEAALLDAITRVTEQLMGKTTSTLLGLGVGVGGRLFSSLTESRNLGLLRDALTQRLGMPAIVESSVDAQAVREVWRRDPASKRPRFPKPHFAMVGLYHDWVSSALVINRKVYRGDHGLAAGIGHLTVDYGPQDVTSRSQPDRPGFYDMCSCGRGYGHLEALATPARIAGQTGLPFEQAARAPYDQRSPLTAAFATAGEALGRGISTMLDIANPGQLLLLLPESLARPVEGTAAVAYKRALLTAVRRYSYFTAADDDDPLHPPTLIIDDIAADEADADAAQAAAVCVLDHFIAYARGE